MPRRLQEILDQADKLADRFEAYEPDPSDRRDPKALESLRLAAASRAQVESDLVHAVTAARDAGYSWATVGVMLGTSGEGARQRYGGLVTH